MVALSTLVLSHAAAEPHPPDVVLYDGEAVSYMVVGNFDQDRPQELAWRAEDRLWIATDLDALTSDLGTAEGPFGRPIAAPDYDGNGVNNLIVVHYTEPEPQRYDYTLRRALDVPWSNMVAADVDGDGFDDLVDGNGVLHGGPEGFTQGATLDEVTADSFFSASPVGDLDGDGSDDLAVCASTTDKHANDAHSAGALRLYLSSDRRAEVWPARWSWEKPPQSEGDGPGSYGFLGYTTGVHVDVADVDGDGVQELVAGSMVADYTLTFRNVTVLDDVLSADGPRVVASQDRQSGDGLSLRTLGDLDGDGDDEMLLTSYNLQIVDAEPVDDHLLDPLPLAPELELPLPEEPEGVSYEYSVDILHSEIGDFDGDGTVDIVAGYSWSGYAGGRITIWFGPSLMPDPPVEPSKDVPHPGRSSPRSCGCASGEGGAAGWALAAVVLSALRRRRLRPGA